MQRFLLLVLTIGGDISANSIDIALNPQALSDNNTRSRIAFVHIPLAGRYGHNAKTESRQVGTKGHKEYNNTNRLHLAWATQSKADY